MRWASVLLLVAMVVASGCVGESSDDAHSAAEPSHPEGGASSHSADDRPATPSERPVNASTPAASPENAARLNMTWSTAEALGDIGVRFEITALDERLECEAVSTVSGTLDAPGPTKWSVLTRDGAGYSWGLSSFGTVAQAHVAGLADTRSLSQGASYVSRTTHGFGMQAGDVMTYTLFAVGVAPVDFGEDFTDGNSLVNHVECDGNATIGRFGVGREMALHTQETLAGGVGAGASGEGSANVMDSASLEIAHGQGLFMMDHWNGAGQFALTHPEGQESWMLQPYFMDRMRTLHGPPGTYSVEVTRAGAYFDLLVFAIAGIEPVDSLDALSAPSPQSSP